MSANSENGLTQAWVLHMVWELTVTKVQTKRPPSKQNQTKKQQKQTTVANHEWTKQEYPTIGFAYYDYPSPGSLYYLLTQTIRFYSFLPSYPSVPE